MKNTEKETLSRKYYAMKQRCYNPKDKEFKNYGERGIKICDDWLSNPKAFYEWAVLSGFELGLTIDRIDVNKDYSPDNCRWVTMTEQQSNKRSNVFVEYNGENITLMEASRRTGIRFGTLWKRFKDGRPLFDALYVWEKPVIRNDGKVFSSIKEAAVKSGVGDSKVSAVCKGKRKSAGGYTFRYLTLEEAEAALKGENE